MQTKKTCPLFSQTKDRIKYFYQNLEQANWFAIFAQKHKYMSVNIIEIKDGRKLHDRLLKKESVSPLEVIRNEYNHFSYNVVRRPEGQCLGNLRYFNLNYDSKTGHFFKKEFNLRHSSNFVITDYWKDRVRCFIVWNYGFGRYFPYNDFVDAMVYDYLIYGRRSVPYSTKVQETENRCVRFYINSQITHLRKVGYKAYREEFKKEHPEYFIDESCRVFRCLDMSLNREEKIAACHAHKRNLRTYIIDSFINRIMKNPTTLHFWFSEYVDREGKNRTCFSDKAVDSLNNRLRNNGLRSNKQLTLYREFRKRVKERFGCNIRTFANNIVMSASTEEVITKAIKKVKSKNMLSLYVSALKKYRKICEVYYSDEDISFDDIFREYGIDLRMCG